MAAKEGKTSNTQKKLLSEATKKLWKTPEFQSKMKNNPRMTGRKH